MCGIAGIYHYNSTQAVDPEVLDRMTDALEHRGPDGRGVFLEAASRASIGLGHRRLSIVDLAATGAQPMHTPDGRYVLVFNGEFYNHADFRAELEANGVQFLGHSDTETLLHLLVRHGLSILERVAGIYTFALWDRKEQRLWLGRDPVGVKQLYYLNDGAKVLFASEIKSFLHHPDFVPELDPESLAQYLHFHTPAGAGTFFRGVRLLQPGETLEMDSKGIRSRRFVFKASGSTETFKTVPEAIDALGDTIRNVVRSQLMSDVPVGCFVSGGIDSTVVAKHMRDFTEGTLHAYGCYFDSAGSVNEEPYAREVAETLSLDLTTVHPSYEDFRSTFARALYYQDEPKIGAALLSMWSVSKLASQHVKVCLGGQASDEIFGGYSRYAVAAPARVLWRELLRRHRYPDPVVGSTLQKQVGRRGMKKRLFSLGAGAFQPWQKRYFDVLASSGAERFFPTLGEVTSRSKAYGFLRTWVAQAPSREPIDRAMYWDQTVYLPGLLAQDDRMSMSQSLETRVPLADPRIVSLAQRIPNAWKLNGFSTKWILKQTLKNVIPTWVINRPKAGFDTPFFLWMQGPGREFVADLLYGERTRQRGLIDVELAKKLMAGAVAPSDETKIWKLINVEQWMRLFIDGDWRSIGIKKSTRPATRVDRSESSLPLT